MQRTRLNTLVSQASLQLRQWAFNPWRRLAVLVISLLFGNFFATAISATAGQAAKLDVTASAILVILVEAISWLYYRTQAKPSPTADRQAGNMVGSRLTTEAPPMRSRSTTLEALNAFKLGMVYGLFVEAFKLGS
ncbi:MAG: DUF565 domain-containing protein [Cyanobacteria bacterium J06623_4]